MAANKIDWPVLRGAITAFVISIMISSALIGSTWYYKNKMLLQYNRDNQQFQAISRQYLAVDQEEKLIRQYYPLFLEMHGAGLLGQEKRLNWIETLRSASAMIRLPGLRYEIAAQTQFTPDYPLNKGSFQLFTSPMKLNVDLLHEGDLQKLFDDLDAHAQGSYNISRCSLRKLGNATFDNATQGNIAAECELKWFNIKKSDGTEINPL